MNSKELWIFLFLIGTLLFNWPFLDIFSLSVPSYLFGVWAIFITVISLFISFANTQGNKDV